MSDIAAQNPVEVPPAGAAVGDVSSTSGKTSSGASVELSSQSGKLGSGETAATSVSGKSGGSVSGGPGLKPWADQSYTPPEGRVGNLTVEHQQILDEYRNVLRTAGILVEPRMDDVYLLR